MIVYNITTQVTWAIHEKWINWLLNEQLPRMLATGLFQRYQLVQLMEVDETEGPTYAIQLFSATIEELNTYKNKHLHEFLAIENELWKDDLVSFSSTMKVIN